MNLSDASAGRVAGDPDPMASPAHKATSRLVQIARSFGSSTFTATSPTRYLTSVSSVAANMSHRKPPRRPPCMPPCNASVAEAASQRAPPEYYPRPVGPANTLGEPFVSTTSCELVLKFPNFYSLLHYLGHRRSRPGLHRWPTVFVL